MDTRFSELRFDNDAHGRTLTGVLMRYGTIGQGPGGMPETFRRDAFGDLNGQDLILTSQHDHSKILARTGGGGLEVINSAAELSIRAVLPRTSEADDALAMIRARLLRGFSVEFHAIEEAYQDGVRVIKKAQLTDLGLVDRPAYRASVLHEIRRRSGRTLRAKIPSGVRLACECSGSPACRFAKMAADGLQAEFDAAFVEATRLGQDDIVASFGSYEKPLASVSKGTLRRSGPTSIDIDVPDDEAGRAVLAAHESAGVIVRPFLDQTLSEFVEEGDTVIYSKPKIRALIVSSTDKREGWPTPQLLPTPAKILDEQRTQHRQPGHRRRIMSCL